MSYYILYDLVLPHSLIKQKVFGKYWGFMCTEKPLNWGMGIFTPPSATQRFFGCENSRICKGTYPKLSESAIFLNRTLKK